MLVDRNSESIYSQIYFCSYRYIFWCNLLYQLFYSADSKKSKPYALYHVFVFIDWLSYCLTGYRRNGGLWFFLDFIFACLRNEFAWSETRGSAFCMDASCSTASFVGSVWQGTFALCILRAILHHVSNCICSNFFSWILCGSITLDRLSGNAENSEQDIAEKDSLTGAANRIWFDKHFIERYNGKPMPTASLVFLIDIDDFKRVNDTYGHLAGDEIICRSVDTIRETIGNNILCRWGGEEFFSFIPFSNIEEAKPLLEKIRKSVESTRYRYKEYDDIRITISIGAVYIEKNTVMDVEEILFEVDRQLYKSKAKGKNRVSF